MLKNKIIILPLEGSWNHSADFLRQTAFTLSKNNLVYIYDQNNHYFFLKKNKKKSYPHHQNIIFHHVKYYLPFERFKLIDKINRHLSFKIFTKTLPKKKKILWIFYPYYYDLAKIAAKSICKIYDCVDYNENQKQEEALNTNDVEESLTISFKLVDSSGNVISYPEINDLGEVINNIDTHSITFKLSSNLLGILRKSKTPSEDIRKIKSMIAKEIKEIVEKNKEYLIHEKDYKVEAFTVIDTVVTGLESTFRNINNMSYSEVENLKNSVSLEDLDSLSCKL